MSESPNPSRLDVTSLPIANLHPDPANPRQMPEDQMAALQRSIQEFGFVEPVIVRRGDHLVVGGHQRVEAAKRLGWTEVPVVEVDLTDDQARALNVALNKIHGEWDVPKLAEILQTLPGDLTALTGFDEKAMSRVLHEAEKALRAMQDETDLDAVPEPPDEATTKPGDVWILGRHRLLCGDSTSPEDLDRLLDGADVHLVNTDPPYNVKVEPRSNNAIAAGLSSFTATHHQGLDVARHPDKARPTHTKLRAKDRPLENDFVSDEKFASLLQAWFQNASRVLLPGHAAYIWGGYANVANYPSALKAAGLYFSQTIIWDKQHPVLTRKDYMGAHEWCQPPGTRVLTPEGEVPIETLRDGDRVVSYSTHNSMILGRRRGYAVRRTQRPYRGNLHGVVVAGRTTWATDGHIWSARMTPEARRYWCVYLMRRGTWWRVGKSKLYTTWGFGPKQRLMFEGGEEAWVLSLHGSNTEAATAEQMVSVRYGIPTTYWSQSRTTSRSEADIRSIYDSLDANRLAANAYHALLDHGRRIEYPLLRRESSLEKVGARVPFLVRTCNLIPDVMAVPVLIGGARFAWTALDEVVGDRFEGTVYSMDVEKHAHYIADGIVTHNCFYGWKEGAAHRFFGPPNVPDLWAVKKVNPQSMVHLTEKPVELAVRAIEYGSLPGEDVLDLFGGSGSTLIGCETTGRNGYLMEIDALYCDVIVSRYEQLTGTKAERIPAEVSP